MFSHLRNSLHPDIQMAVHQMARFSVNPMRSQELAIMHIGQYVGLSTKSSIQKELKFTLMQILQEDGVLLMQTIPTTYYLGLVLLYAM
jgi:hypothetical protein